MTNSNNNSTVTFDFDKNTITYPDINLFRAFSFSASAQDIRSIDDSFYDEKGEKIPNQVRMTTIKNAKSTFSAAPRVITIPLSDYHIKIETNKNDKYLVPFTTFYNVCGPSFIACLYNGENLFYTGQQLDESVKDDNGKTLKDIYYSFKPTGKRSADLKNYNYYEFCRDLDYTYGLKDEHGIESFDYLLSGDGIKDLLMSDSRYEEDKGFYALYTRELADLHTSFTTQNAYEEYDAQETTNIAKEISANPAFTQKISKLFDICLQRIKYKNVTGAFGDTTVVKPYQVTNGTAIITFDKFIMNGTKDYYYSDAFKNNKEEIAMSGKDAVALVSYANDKIREDMNGAKNIKRIVIDLSGNTGGEADVALFILSWLNSSILQLEDPISGGKGSLEYASDINFDKVIDSNDTLVSTSFLEPNKFQGKVYCLTSESSFSCGNYVPAMLKQSQLATIIGTKSGGGACSVHVGGTADGSGFSFSSNNRICIDTNGSYYHIDRGIEPDVYLHDSETLYGGSTEEGGAQTGDRLNITKYLEALEKAY